MAHEVHTTRAIILASAEVQDADKLFWLFTEDFGLLFASAKSVREETSKLRYALQDLSKTRVSLVRGRGMWRITGAETLPNSAPLQYAQQNIFGKISSLVRRVVPFDQKHKDIFELLETAYDTLSAGAPMQHVEEVTVARILFNLGYVPPNVKYNDILQGTKLDMRYNQDVQKILVEAINTGLVESQL
tara:strand:+ start:12683 stop:13246 length:564 start_codon:yes stop_codon:yes gene_type:complete